MKRRKKTFQQRKHTRFRVKDGAFAVSRTPYRELWPIEDISKEGLSFRYLEERNGPSRLSELDILTRDNRFYLENLPLEIVSDVEFSKDSLLGYKTIRRCGVQFGKLKEAQKSQLDDFLRTRTMLEE